MDSSPPIRPQEGILGTTSTALFFSFSLVNFLSVNSVLHHLVNGDINYSDITEPIAEWRSNHGFQFNDNLSVQIFRVRIYVAHLKCADFYS